MGLCAFLVRRASDPQERPPVHDGPMYLLYLRLRATGAGPGRQSGRWRGSGSKDRFIG